MNYNELKEKQAKRISDFPIIWAFSDKQLQEGMDKLNCTNKDELISIGCGGIMRKNDYLSWKNMEKRHYEELQENLKNKEFLYNAIKSEFANHECYFTGEYDEIFSSLGIEKTVENFAIIQKIYNEEKEWQKIHG